MKEIDILVVGRSIKIIDVMDLDFRLVSCNLFLSLTTAFDSLADTLASSSSSPPLSFSLSVSLSLAVSISLFLSLFLSPPKV